MERNDLVLYLDIPEFSEALHASKWRTDIVLPQAGDNICPENLLSEKTLAMLETVSAGEVWEDMKDDCPDHAPGRGARAVPGDGTGISPAQGRDTVLHADAAKIPCARCRKADENRSAATLSSPGRGTEKRENPVLFPEILCAYRRAGHAAAIPGGT